MWWVYALYNKKVSKIYIGYSSNVERRLKEHNEKRGRHYTAKQKGEWFLVYKEELQTKREALKREKQQKSYQGRRFIKNLIISPVAQR